MTHGSGGKLPEAGARLINGLEQHPDPIALVERTRRLFPSATIRTDRGHPTYPHAGGPAEAPRSAPLLASSAGPPSTETT